MRGSYSIRIVTPPASRPVTVRDAKKHLRLLGNDSDDEYLDGLIRACTEYVENYTQITLIPTQYIFTLDQFPYNILNRNIPYDHKLNALLCPRNPVVSLDKLEYTDTDGTVNQVTNAIISTAKWPARIIPARGEVFPFADYYGLDSVRITFTAGYPNGDYSYMLCHAIKLMVSHFYENREPFMEKPLTEVPMSINALLRKHKYMRFVV